MAKQDKEKPGKPLITRRMGPHENIIEIPMSVARLISQEELLKIGMDNLELKLVDIENSTIEQVEAYALGKADRLGLDYVCLNTPLMGLDPNSGRTVSNESDYDTYIINFYRERQGDSE